MSFPTPDEMKEAAAHTAEKDLEKARARMAAYGTELAKRKGTPPPYKIDEIRFRDGGAVLKVEMIKAFREKGWHAEFDRSVGAYWILNPPGPAPLAGTTDHPFYVPSSGAGY